MHKSHHPKAFDIDNNASAFVVGIEAIIAKVSKLKCAFDC